MLSAKRKSDGQTVTAYLESKSNAPFVCLQCNEEVILKIGRNRVNHFAHANPIACKFSAGESEIHRRCKMEIYEALKRAPGVRNAAIEQPLGTVRPDVSAVINGVPVAIALQISSLSLETIMRRTIELEPQIAALEKRRANRLEPLRNSILQANQAETTLAVRRSEDVAARNSKWWSRGESNP